MNLRLYTSILLAAFVLLAVFGLYIPFLGHTGHEMGCPFGHGTVMCAAPLMHIEHWQSALVAVLTQIFMLGALLVFAVWLQPYAARDPQYERYRLRVHLPKRPTLFQELFSQGIHNRKAP